MSGEGRGGLGEGDSGESIELEGFVGRCFYYFSLFTFDLPEHQAIGGVGEIKLAEGGGGGYCFGCFDAFAV